MLFNPPRRITSRTQLRTQPAGPPERYFAGESTIG